MGDLGEKSVPHSDPLAYLSLALSSPPSEPGSPGIITFILSSPCIKHVEAKLRG